MEFRHLSPFLLISMILTVFGCSSGTKSEPNNGDPIVIEGAEYREIDQNSGFSAAYLSGKVFYRPFGYETNFYVKTYSFSGNTVSWGDNLSGGGSGTSSFRIETINGINGVLVYDDGVYDLYFNVHSVHSDHLKVCYTYQGYLPVALCDEADALTWSFGDIPDDSNAVGFWSHVDSSTQCTETFTLNGNGSFATTSLDKETSGTYRLMKLSGGSSKYLFYGDFESDNQQSNCEGGSFDLTGQTRYTFFEFSDTEMFLFNDVDSTTPLVTFTRQ